MIDDLRFWWANATPGARIIVRLVIVGLLSLFTAGLFLVVYALFLGLAWLWERINAKSQPAPCPTIKGEHIQ